MKPVAYLLVLVAILSTIGMFDATFSHNNYAIFVLLLSYFLSLWLIAEHISKVTNEYVSQSELEEPMKH